MTTIVRAVPWRPRLLRTYATAPLPRVYRYWVDVHGQLFLYDTVPKNLTSCFKATPFLNFFFARVERNPVWGTAPVGPPGPMCEGEQVHWSEDADALAQVMGKQRNMQALFRAMQAEGFTWLSKCQGEWNMIHAVDTPIVFRKLSEDGTLTWGGDYTMPFQPDRLRVHPDTGYLYHPSPTPPLRSRANRAPYGAYSLVASHVVLQRLADGLEIEDDGGTVRWQGATHALAPLEPGDLA